MPDFVKIKDKPKLYQAADTENIKAVVGGKNTENFAPSANISFKMRSGEEKYFFNICDDIKQVKTVGKEEDWNGNKLKIKDGDIESTFELFDTSLKIERVFHKKPTTAPRYKLKYSKGISFHYQPELTQEEIDEGVVRPDNVVGSYAVRCDKQGHYKDENGKTRVDYGCGKIGHLYAPYWTDAEGEKVKGVQRVEGDYLIFDLPDQTWIDSAKLPITLDPDIGYTTAGASSTTHNTGILYFIDAYAASSDGTLDDMSIYCEAVSGGGRLTMGLFTISGSTATKVDDTVGDTISTTGMSWRAQNVNSGASVSNGTDYHPAWIIETSSTIRVAFDSTSDSMRYKFTSYSHGSLAASYTGLVNWVARSYSIYASYTESGGGDGLLPIIMHYNQKMRV